MKHSPVSPLADLEDQELWQSELGQYIQHEADDTISVEEIPLCSCSHPGIARDGNPPGARRTLKDAPVYAPCPARSEKPCVCLSAMAR
jgi:hypothetical protein